MDLALAKSMGFTLPPKIKTRDGNTRQVGFEIEFAGIPLKETCEIIQKLFGGDIQQTNSFSFSVKGTKYGDFEVESDARFLSEKRYDKYLKKIGINSSSAIEGIEKFFSSGLASKFLPFEIAMPPLPITNLNPAERVREELYKHSAKGTHSSIFSAFGTQFNPEVPDFQAETLLSYLRAFFLLFDWLEEVENIVIARQIAPYINPFPQHYIDRILNPDYKPNLKEFMSDYLECNPTRNRPLDLLPLFTYIDKDLVFKYPVEKDLVKPRPTFHYRLPNSEIDDPNWNLAREWNRWVQVENLAAQVDYQIDLCAEYLRLKNQSLVFPRQTWISISSRRIDVPA